MMSTLQGGHHQRFSLSSFTLDQHSSGYSESLASSVLTTTSTSNTQGDFSLGGSTVNSGASTSTSTQAHRQSSSVSRSFAVDLYEAGTMDASGSFALTSYSLYAESDFDSDKSVTDTSNFTATGGSYTGSGSETVTELTWEHRSGTLSQQGTYASGAWSLTSVSFTAAGNSGFTFDKSGTKEWSGEYSGNDSFTVSAAGLVYDNVLNSAHILFGGLLCGRKAMTVTFHSTRGDSHE